jgi:hypothetical protein
MREFRQDSHTFPLVLWTLLMMGSALVILHQAGTRAAAVVAGAGLLIVAPIAFAVYLYRARRVWVAVDPGRGLVVSGRHVIPWNEIGSVERRRPRLRSTSGPVDPKALGDFNAPGCESLGLELGGLGAALGLIIAALFVFWLICFVFLPLLIVPVLEVFAPFGERIRILPVRGRPLVLRDLRGADDFMAALPRGVRTVMK